MSWWPRADRRDDFDVLSVMANLHRLDGAHLLDFEDNKDASRTSGPKGEPSHAAGIPTVEAVALVRQSAVQADQARQEKVA